MKRFDPPRRITEKDDCTGFDCGVRIVNEWLPRHLHTAWQQHTAVPYGVFDGSKLVAYYTLSAHAMRHKDASGWLRRNSPDPIPVILLGMLGVDVRYQTMRLGSQLLKDAIVRSATVSEVVGARALVVEPVDDTAKGFYARFGFRQCGKTMFLPLRPLIPPHG